jgi:hypothetical protein
MRAFDEQGDSPSRSSLSHPTRKPLVPLEKGCDGRRFRTEWSLVGRRAVPLVLNIEYIRLVRSKVWT